jgi:hypothetical protein
MLPLAAVALAGCFGGFAPAASVQGITKIVFDTATSEKVTFAGATFGPGGAVGTYEKVRGTAYGQIDPNDPKNQVIADIGLALEAVQAVLTSGEWREERFAPKGMVS